MACLLASALDALVLRSRSIFGSRRQPELRDSLADGCDATAIRVADPDIERGRPVTMRLDVAPLSSMSVSSQIYRMGEVEIHALRQVSLRLHEGHFIVLLGPSGSGKSTLLNILGGLDVPTSGQVLYRDTDLTRADEAALTAYRRRHVGFVFQFYNLIPSLTARENVALVTEISEHPMGLWRSPREPDGGGNLSRAALRWRANAWRSRAQVRTPRPRRSRSAFTGIVAGCAGRTRSATRTTTTTGKMADRSSVWPTARATTRRTKSSPAGTVVVK